MSASKLQLLKPGLALLHTSDAVEQLPPSSGGTTKLFLSSQPKGRSLPFAMSVVFEWQGAGLAGRVPRNATPSTDHRQCQYLHGLGSVWASGRNRILGSPRSQYITSSTNATQFVCALRADTRSCRDVRTVLEVPRLWTVSLILRLRLLELHDKYELGLDKGGSTSATVFQGR